jgi:sphinganine-1-phosphate aldolase
MAVTRPQTQSGVVEAWVTDLDAAVRYARANRDAPAKSGAIYGSVPGGLTAEADEFIRAVMSDMMDQQQGLPPA